jgi:hypothetical protein
MNPDGRRSAAECRSQGGCRTRSGRSVSPPYEWGGMPASAPSRGRLTGSYRWRQLDQMSSLATPTTAHATSIAPGATPSRRRCSRAGSGVLRSPAPRVARPARGHDDLETVRTMRRASQTFGQREGASLPRIFTSTGSARTPTARSCGLATGRTRASWRGSSAAAKAKRGRSTPRSGSYPDRRGWHLHRWSGRHPASARFRTGAALNLPSWLSTRQEDPHRARRAHVR